jgi:transcriptional regulator GlxA family with amidase domain
MQDLGRDFSELNQTFEQALAYLPTQPRRTEIKLWDILWMLAEKTNRSSRAAEGVHPAIQKAFQLIEQRLGERIRVSELARDVEISHNQLTRLFQTATGGTVVEYIRARRMQRVEHLLVHSTMQIKAIAYEVGLGDLQQFNKAVHRAFGDSPRNIRNRR